MSRPSEVGSVLDGPDPQHLVELHRPHPVDQLRDWPPQDALWTSTYLRLHRNALLTVLAVAIVVALLASG